MKFRPLLRVCAALALSGLAQAADEARFSKTLTAEEATGIGLARLDSDQVAALDALVRRDIAAADYIYKTPRAPRFTQRLTDEERRAAGLLQLDAAALDRLDAAVARATPPPRVPINVAALSRTGGETASSTAVVRSMTLRRGPEIHGAVSLMVGAGSGGYSEMGAGLVLTYDDPAHDFSLLVGYSEIHTKGGYYYRGYRDGYDCWPYLFP